MPPTPPPTPPHPAPPQPHAAAAFFAGDPNAARSRGADAAHLALALEADGLLASAPPVAGVAPAGALRLAPADVVASYARSVFLRPPADSGPDARVEGACEYFSAAADAVDGAGGWTSSRPRGADARQAAASSAAESNGDPARPSVAFGARAALLQELIVSTRAYATLLGRPSGGWGAVAPLGADARAARASGLPPPPPRGLAARLAGPGVDVDALLAEVARRCRNAAQCEAAAEISLARGDAAGALGLVVARLGDLLSSAAGPEAAELADTPEWVALARRGEAAAAMGMGMGDGGAATSAAAGDLEALRALAALTSAERRGRPRAALDAAGRLSRFLPGPGEGPGAASLRCARAAAASPVVLPHMGEALVALAGALAAQADDALGRDATPELRGVAARAEAAADVAGHLGQGRACRALFDLGRRLRAAGGGE